jgi:hypothetical protein
LEHCVLDHGIGAMVLETIVFWAMVLETIVLGTMMF